MLFQAKRYQNFPKYTMIAGLSNTLSGSFTNILISGIFSVTTLGFYSLVQRILSMPTVLIGNSVSQVFIQQASEEKQLTGNSILTFKKVLKNLLLVGFPIFSIIFFFIEDLTAIVFGETWRIAGVYAKILTPFFFVRFISSCLSGTLDLFEKQRMGLMINILIMITTFSLVIIINDFKTFLYSLNIIMSLYYSIFLIYYYNISKG